MYTFKIETDLKAYDSFLEANGGQYIQCSRWQNVKTTWNCRYYCGFDEKNEVVGVDTLLIVEEDKKEEIKFDITNYYSKYVRAKNIKIYKKCFYSCKIKIKDYSYIAR